MSASSFFASVIALSVMMTGASAGSVDENKKIVLDFYEKSFIRHQPRQAAETYLIQNYIQHNPRVPNGRDAFSGFFEGYFARNPSASSIVKRVISEGDLVVIHANAKMNAQDRGKAMIDIFRVEIGLIVEHWDVIQDVPEASANGNTMFD